MIQDIAPLKFYNEYRQQQISDDSYILAFKGNGIYLKKDARIEFPTWEQVRSAIGSGSEDAPKNDDIMSIKNSAVNSQIYLFSIDSKAYFLFDLTNIQLPGFEYVRMFDVRRLNPKSQVMAAATGWHLYQWYAANKFCGRCGKPLVHDEKQRMLKCPECGNMVFPKIAPAVIVGVKHGDYILMTKYADREYKRYALIAGFIEIGETPEQTVVREVMEEVGLPVKNVRYYGSQPWGFDSNLLLGYYCDLAEDAGDIVLDKEELSIAEWVHYKDIPADHEGLSLTAEMMGYFRDHEGKV